MCHELQCGCRRDTLRQLEAIDSLSQDSTNTPQPSPLASDAGKADAKASRLGFTGFPPSPSDDAASDQPDDHIDVHARSHLRLPGFNGLVRGCDVTFPSEWTSKTEEALPAGQHDTATNRRCVYLKVHLSTKHYFLQAMPFIHSLILASSVPFIPDRRNFSCIGAALLLLLL